MEPATVNWTNHEEVLQATTWTLGIIDSLVRDGIFTRGPMGLTADLGSMHFIDIPREFFLSKKDIFNIASEMQGQDCDSAVVDAIYDRGFNRSVDPELAR